MKICKWITMGLLACTSLAFEQRAEACSPPPPGLYSSIPHDGEVYPANAALLFQGDEISLDGVTVTVDGAPAAFAAPAQSVKDMATIAAIISPEPMAGQTVAVQGNFCKPGAPPQGPCKPFSLTYKAGPRDEGSLAGVHIASFDIHDYPDYMGGGGDCTYSSDFAFWMHIASPDQPGASPRFYTIEGYHGKALTDLAVKQSGFLPSDGTVDIRSFKGALKGASLPEALCFRVTMADAAGHVSAPSDLVCDPCHYHVDPSTTPATFDPPQPAWSESDIYPGGSCDLGGSGGGGTGSSTSSTGHGGSGGGGAGSSTSSTGSSNDKNEAAFGGCACQSAGGVGSPPAPLVLTFCAALAVGARRRRRS